MCVYTYKRVEINRGKFAITWRTLHLGFTGKYRFNRGILHICKTRTWNSYCVCVWVRKRWNLRAIRSPTNAPSDSPGFAHPDTSNSRLTLMTLIRSTSRCRRSSYALLYARILPRRRSIDLCIKDLSSWRRKFRNHWRNGKRYKVMRSIQSVICRERETILRI